MLFYLYLCLPYFIFLEKHDTIMRILFLMSKRTMEFKSNNMPFNKKSINKMRYLVK